MNIMAIITNMALIGFSYDTISEAIPGNNNAFWVLVVVVGLEVNSFPRIIIKHFLLLIRWLLSVSIPDASVIIKRKLALQEFLKKEANKYQYFKLEASLSITKKEESSKSS